jgi:hypothetical protein
LNGDIDYLSDKKETFTLKYTIDGKEEILTFDGILFKTDVLTMNGLSPQRGKFLKSNFLKIVTMREDILTPKQNNALFTME